MPGSDRAEYSPVDGDDYDPEMQPRKPVNSSTTPAAAPPHQGGPYYSSTMYTHASNAARRFWDRLRGKGRRKIGWMESLQNIVLSSCE